MNLSPLHIWATMGLMSKLIASFLLVMAVVSIAVVIERLLAFFRGEAESRAFAKKAAPLLDAWDHHGLVALADKHHASPLARLVGPVVRSYVRGHGDRDGGLDAVERARREAARCLEAAGAELRRGLSVLASVGSVAPFVGLLGTVVGIITAFQGIASTGSGGLGAVSAGIAEALVETALGLMVAIPSVLCFNYLTGRVGQIEMALARSSGELLDEMENEHGRDVEYKSGEKVAA